MLCEDLSPTVLIEDSSSTVWIRPLFSLLWFYPLSQSSFVFSDYRRLVSIVIANPMLLLKLGFIWVSSSFLQFRFILALEGSCWVDCLSGRLSLLLILVFSCDRYF